MKIQLNKILNNGVDIDEDIYLDKNFYKDSQILDIKKFHIEGNINFDYENNLIIDLEAKGIFILEDAITLEPVEYNFSCKIEEEIQNLEETCGEFYEKSKNTLDISEILWENIVLEVPISYTTSKTDEIIIKGEGWELKNDNVKKIDPRLAKLTELLDKGKE